MVITSKTKLTGKKVKGSVYEQDLITWIIAEPKISNLALARKVIKKYGIKISSATVGAYRKNFFPSDVEVLQKLEKDKLQTVKQFEDAVSTKIGGTIDFYLQSAESLIRRIDLLKDMQAVYMKTRQGRVLNTSIENLIIDYYKLLDQYRSRAFKFTGGVEYLQKLRSLITTVATEAVKVFVPYVDQKDLAAARKDFEACINKIERTLHEDLPHLSKLSD